MRHDPTAAERQLWQHLRANRLGGHHFRQQQIIDGFIADFYCHEAGLIIEVDGGVHVDTVEYDRQRDAALASRGLRVLRVSNEDVLERMGEVLSRIAEALGDGEGPT